MSCNRLDRLEWQYENGEHRLDLTSGRAIIRERAIGDFILYEPEIHSTTGEIMADFPETFDLEDAKTFVRASLSWLDKLGVDEAEYVEKLASTIDLCIERLPGDERRFHRMRLENIKRWLRQPLYAEMVAPPETYDWKNHDFDWEYTDDMCTANTVHGKVVIEERREKSHFVLGSAARHYLRIVDTTGVALKFHLEYIDFIEAEDAARRVLSELEDPAIRIRNLHTIWFSLQICHCVLSENADLAHDVRLEYVVDHLRRHCSR